MSEKLDSKKLAKVIQWLKEADFDKIRWQELGGILGLRDNTLKKINRNERGDTDDCFRECLVKWLKRSDDVDDVGKPSLDTLAGALDKMDDCKDQADYIRKLAREEDASKMGEKNAKSMRPEIDSTKKNNKDGGDQASAGDDVIDGPTQPQDPPQDKKKCREEEFSEDLVQGIEILLLPATNAEEKPVMEYLEQSPKGYTKTYIDGTVTLYIGYYGERKVIVSKIARDKSMQGPVHAAIITTKIIERVKSIKHVVAVGVCFGKDPDKQELGQVIVSDTIFDCVSIRQGVNIDEQRGRAYTVKLHTKDLFYFTDYEPQPKDIKYLVGPIITTSDLIDNPQIKKKLFDLIPNAIAGEMEGAGIMTAIEYVPDRVGGIVIKGIGDWADGDKEATKKWKPIAACNAAQYVYAVLNK